MRVFILIYTFMKYLKYFENKNEFNHYWYWKSKLPERNGQKCKVIKRGKKNSILIEFEDGYKVVTSRFAVRQSNPTYKKKINEGLFDNKYTNLDTQNHIIELLDYIKNNNQPYICKYDNTIREDRETITTINTYIKLNNNQLINIKKTENHFHGKEIPIDTSYFSLNIMERYFDDLEDEEMGFDNMDKKVNIGVFSGCGIISMLFNSVKRKLRLNLWKLHKKTKILQPNEEIDFNNLNKIDMYFKIENDISKYLSNYW